MQSLSGGLEITVPFRKRVGNVIQKITFLGLGPVYVIWLVFARVIELFCCCCIGKKPYFQKMEAKIEGITLEDLCGFNPANVTPTPDLRALAEVNARMMKKNMPLSIQLSFD